MLNKDDVRSLRSSTPSARKLVVPCRRRTASSSKNRHTRTPPECHRWFGLWHCKGGSSTLTAAARCNSATRVCSPRICASRCRRSQALHGNKALAESCVLATELIGLRLQPCAAGVCICLQARRQLPARALRTTGLSLSTQAAGSTRGHCLRQDRSGATVCASSSLTSAATVADSSIIRSNSLSGCAKGLHCPRGSLECPACSLRKCSRRGRRRGTRRAAGNASFASRSNGTRSNSGRIWRRGCCNTRRNHSASAVWPPDRYCVRAVPNRRQDSAVASRFTTNPKMTRARKSRQQQGWPCRMRLPPLRPRNSRQPS